MALVQHFDRARIALVVGRIHAVTLQRYDLHHWHQLILALDPDHPDFPRDEARAGLFEGWPISQDPDLEWPREAFQSPSEIHGAADDRIIEAFLAPEIADDRISRAYADADFYVRKALIAFRQRLQLGHHSKRALQRLARGIFDRHRRAPE